MLSSMANRGVSQPNSLKNLLFWYRRLNGAPSPITSQLNFEDKSVETHDGQAPFTSDKISNLEDAKELFSQVSTSSLLKSVDTHVGAAHIPFISSFDKIINLEDAKELFSQVSTSRLLTSSATLQLAAFGPTVDMGMWVMKSGLMRTPILKEVILSAVKRSFYRHFVAGKDLEEAGNTVIRLWDAGLRGMLDYGSEHATDNESCDRNMVEFIKTIESSKSLPPSSVSHAVVKITAICLPSLLRRVSDLLRWECRDGCFHLPWKIKTLPIFSDSSPLYHTPIRPQPLTLEEEENLKLSQERLFKICQHCVEANIPLVIDAEDTTVQPAIDYFTYSSAIMYHKDDIPVVFGTMQTYLKDAKERLIRAKKASEELGSPIGFKLVRGAYMSSERAIAASLGVDSPIHSNIQETHDCYNTCADYMLEKVANRSGAVVLATHNVESGKLAAAKATDLGIKKQDQGLQFAQLYGMAEALSFGLRNAGFQVSKYLPFGPVEQIMPYLLRRAEENRGLLSTSSLDRQLMRKELRRRFNSFFT